MTLNEFGDCSVEDSTLLSYGVFPWVRTKEFVYHRASVIPGSHSGANYQGKKGIRYVEITVFQVLGVECSMCPKILFK